MLPDVPEMSSYATSISVWEELLKLLGKLSSLNLFLLLKSNGIVTSCMQLKWPDSQRAIGRNAVRGGARLYAATAKMVSAVWATLYYCRDTSLTLLEIPAGT